MKTKILLLLGITGLAAGFLLLDPFNLLHPNFVTQLIVEQSEPNRIFPSLEPLSSGDWESFGELAGYASSASDKTIIDIAANWEAGQLLAIDSAGVFYSWDLATQRLEDEHPLNLELETGEVNFSANGAYLLLPAGRHQSPLIANTLNSGLILFDTLSREVVRCYGMPCSPEKDYLLLNRGSLLTPNAGYVFYYLEDGFAYFNPGLLPTAANHDGGRGYQQAEAGLGAVSRIALDLHGVYLALAFESGSLVIERLDLHRGNVLGINFRTTTWISTASGDSPEQTRALQFDPSRTWLARLTGKQLSIWDLRTDNSEPAVELAVQAGSVLAFDRNGRFLFIGSQTGLLIYQPESGELVDIVELGPVTSLQITPDNRLLLWGDDRGSVHAWGINPQ